MFIVIEMQTNNGTTAIVPPVTFDDINKAYQKYYQVLSAAAVSSVPTHTAIILTERGDVVRVEHFEHNEVTEE